MARRTRLEDKRLGGHAFEHQARVAEYVADKVRERFGVRDVVINYVDPVIGAHSGPGTMALFYMAESRN